MQQIRDYADILNKFRQNALDNDADPIDMDTKAKVQPDLGEPVSNEEALDFLKNNAPRSKGAESPIKAEKFANAIESGKVKSFAPEDLHNPSKDLDSKLESANPVKENVAEQVAPSEAKTPIEEVAAKKDLPKVDEAVAEAATPAEEAVASKAMAPSTPNVSALNGIGASLGMDALNQAKQDPSNPVYKLNALVDPENNPIQQIAKKSEDFPVNLATQDPTNLSQNFSNVKDLSPQALAQLQSGNQTPPNQLPVGAPTSMPAALMANQPVQAPSPAPEAAPPVPMASSPEQHEAPENKLSQLLNQYRSMASDQNTGLKAAQDQARQNEFAANLMKGVNQLNAGITGNKITGPAKVDNETLNGLLKNANSPIDNYTQQVADEKNNPSSKYSQIMREFLAPKLKNAGIDVNSEDYKNMPASSLETVAKYAEQETQAQLKKDFTTAVHQHTEQLKQNNQDQKTEDRFDNNLTKFNTNLSKPEVAGRMGVVAKNIGIRDNADRINALIDSAGGDYNKLTNSQVYEIAKSMDSMLSNGASTLGGSKEFQPQTWSGRLAHFAEAATADPQGAGQGGFVKLFKDTIDREKNVANKKVQNFYEDAKEGIPDRDYEARKPQYDRILNAKIARVQQEQADNIKQPNAVVKMMGPDGKVRMVPKDQVQAAQAAGGKLV